MQEVFRQHHIDRKILYLKQELKFFVIKEKWSILSITVSRLNMIKIKCLLYNQKEVG